MDLHARRSRKASARPDVRRRDHDEVAHGDPRWEEAGHRSRWTVLHALGRGKAGTRCNSGKRPGQVKEWFYVGPHIMVVLPDSAKDALRGINQDLSNNQPYISFLSSADVATPIWVIPVAKGGDRIKEEAAK